MHYDVFNGDADGICALHQLRLASPKKDATLITGVKRDIKLLSKIENVVSSTITTLDVSLDSNRVALLALLEQGNKVTYIDHHFAGTLPDSPELTSHIDTSATTCTALIVNKMLDNAHAAWAICGAFGDNLHPVALQLCDDLGFSVSERNQLREIGELLNYNGYGTTVEDLHFSPEALYQAVHRFTDPFKFHQQSNELSTLREGYATDMEEALKIDEYQTEGKNRVYIFPDTRWAKRVSGVFSNHRAREQEDSAHALITPNDDDTLRISVRAPLTDKRDADTLCHEFPTGGGRKAGAGINSLPSSMLEKFLTRFAEIYS